MKTKKIPVRLCVSCRKPGPKRELMRIAKDANGGLFVDTTGKAQGRGAYICYDVACLERAKKTKALERALEAEYTEDFYASAKRVILRRGIE